MTGALDIFSPRDDSRSLWIPAVPAARIQAGVCHSPVSHPGCPATCCLQGGHAGYFNLMRWYVRCLPDAGIENLCCKRTRKTASQLFRLPCDNSAQTRPEFHEYRRVQMHHTLRLEGRTCIPVSRFLERFACKSTGKHQMLLCLCFRGQNSEWRYWMECHHMSSLLTSSPCPRLSFPPSNSIARNIVPSTRSL